MSQAAAPTPSTASAAPAIPLGPVILLRRPPDWAEHEKPALPGSPAMPHHLPWVRACYGLIAVLLGLTGGLGNALFSANLPTIQGQMGLTSVEAEEKLRENGKRGRGAKEHIDAMAAQIILQCFFENQ